MATFSSLTGANRDAPKMRVLERVLYICYLVQFCKDKGKNVLALLDSGSKINVMTLAYAAHLDLNVRVTHVNVQKIDSLSLATYNIVIAAFQVVDKLNRFWIFQETFLLADISMEVVLGMLFLTFSNADVQFAELKVTWRIYIIKKALPITCQVKIINRK